MNPKVTIYITNYNYGKFISKAIDSVVKQTFKKIEILIIDDGSTDNSKKIINNYTRKYPFIYSQFNKNDGLIKTCNKALRQAKGEYILRLDADDWLDKNAIEIMFNKLEKNKERELIFPDYYEVNTNGNILHTIRRHDFENVKLFDAPAHGACTLFRTRTLILNGGYDENFTCQDGVDIWLRFYKKFKIMNINIPLFFYRRHGVNLTENKKKILENKNKILFKNNNNNKKKVIAFLPIRGEKYEKFTNIFSKLGNKNLIDWTIESLLAVKSFDYIVISSPDKKVLDYVGKIKNKKILPFKRNLDLSTQGVLIDDSVKDAVEKLKKTIGYKAEYIVVSKFNCPFRNYKHIENAINTIQIFNLDLVYGVSTKNALYFKHNGKTLKPLRNYDSTQITTRNKKIQMKIENEEIFIENGDFIVNSVDYFYDNSNKKLRIGHEMLNDISSFKINNKFDFEIAQQIAKNYKKFTSF